MPYALSFMNLVNPGFNPGFNTYCNPCCMVIEPTITKYEQREFNIEKTQILQTEISLSKLRSYFENFNYDCVKRVEIITKISERQVPGINIYIKKIPNIESHIMDVYGKKEDIKIYDLLNKGDNENGIWS